MLLLLRAPAYCHAPPCASVYVDSTSTFFVAGGTIDISELKAAIRAMNEMFHCNQEEEIACQKRIDSCEHVANYIERAVILTEAAEVAEEKLHRFTTHPPLMARVGKALQEQMAKSKTKDLALADLAPKWLGTADEGQANGLLHRAAFLKQVNMLKNVGALRMEGTSSEVSSQFDTLYDDLVVQVGVVEGSSAGPGPGLNAVDTLNALQAAVVKIDASRARLEKEASEARERAQREQQAVEEKSKAEQQEAEAAEAHANAAQAHAEQTTAEAEEEARAKRAALLQRRSEREALELEEKEKRIAARRAATALGQAFTPRVAGTPKATPRATPKSTPRNAPTNEAFKKVDGGRMGYGTEKRAYQAPPRPKLGAPSSATPTEVKAATKIEALVRGKSSRLHVVDLSKHDGTMSFGGSFHDHAPASLAIE